MREMPPGLAPVMLHVVMIAVEVVVAIVIVVVIVSMMMMAIPVAIVVEIGARIVLGSARDALELGPDRCDELQLLLGQIRRMIGGGPRAGDDLAQRLRGDEARPSPAGLIAFACQQRVEARQQLGWDGNHI